MTSSFIRKLACSFETGQSIRSIQQAVRNVWSGNWRDRATLYNADHGTSIDPGSFDQHCRFLGSRRTLVETVVDIFNTYLARPLSTDMAALHQQHCRQVAADMLPMNQPFKQHQHTNACSTPYIDWRACLVCSWQALSLRCVVGKLSHYS